MKKPDKLSPKNSRNDNRDTNWRLGKHINSIMDHYESLEGIVSSRIHEHFGTDQAKVRELYESLAIIQSLRDMKRVLNLIPFDNAPSSTYCVDSEQWITDLDEVRKQLALFPTKSQLSPTLEKVISKHARSHVTAIRRMIPDVIENVDRFRSPHIQSDKVSTPNIRNIPLPSQIDAPIMTAVNDDTLIEIPGKLITTSDNIKELTDYLLMQVKRITSELSGTNIDRRDIEIFAETVEILGDWSTSKILSFGAHLCLLENVATTMLKADEVAKPIANRIGNFLLRSREFVNSFEEWRTYTNQSTVFAVNDGSSLGEIQQNFEGVAVALQSEGDSVESRIPRALSQYAGLTGESDNKTQSIGIMSAFGSVRNISISLIRYVRDVTKSGLAVLPDSRVARLLRVICRALPRLATLAHIAPSFSFFLAHIDQIKAACEILGMSKHKDPS